MQRLCKSNAIKLALIAEMPPILCKDTVFLSHRQTSWIILTQRLRVSGLSAVSHVLLHRKPPIQRPHYLSAG